MNWRSVGVGGWSLSLALHGLALAGMLALAGREASPPMRWEVAMVVPVPAEAKPVSKPEHRVERPPEPASRPRPAPMAPSPPPPVQKPDPEPVRQPAPIQAAMPAIASATASAVTPTIPAPDAGAKARPAPVALEKPVAAPSPAPPDPEAQRRWQALLAAKLMELKRYPMPARRLGQEGVVLLEARFQADGRAAANIKRSSGHAALDRAAVKLFEEAIAALAGQLNPRGDSQLDIPVAYRLES